MDNLNEDYNMSKFVKKIAANSLLPKYQSLEHIVMESIDLYCTKEGGGLAVANIIDTMNNDYRIKDISGYDKKTSNGAVYGTLSRLKGKSFLSKVIILDNHEDEVLAYKLTGAGDTALNQIREKARNSVKSLPGGMEPAGVTVPV
jgi:hypothetical protein